MPHLPENEVWSDADCLDEFLRIEEERELDPVADAEIIAKLEGATFKFPVLAFACWNNSDGPCTRSYGVERGRGTDDWRTTEQYGECLLRKLGKVCQTQAT